MKKKSFFLLGPRSTGKTTLIQSQLVDKALIIDLLKKYRAGGRKALENHNDFLENRFFEQISNP